MSTTSIRLDTGGRLMKKLIVGGLAALAVGLGLAAPANACPCVEGSTRYSPDSDLTYTCRSGQWYEGPYGPDDYSALPPPPACAAVSIRLVIA